MTPRRLPNSLRIATSEGRRRFVTVRLARLVREASFPGLGSKRSGPVEIRAPRDVHAFMAPYAARELVEVLWMLPLDALNRVATDGPVVISRGLVNCSLAHAREVFAAAIVAHATAIIIAHNHPSGDPNPSIDDRCVTQQLVTAGRVLDIPVQDHVILGRGTYVSFAELKLL